MNDSQQTLRHHAATAIRLATHPACLSLAAVASIILWMPFGMGYYGWPWHSASMRLMLACFVYSLPLIAVVGIIGAFTPSFSVVRALVSIGTLLVALFGIFAMCSWQSSYVQPMLQRANASPVSTPP
jgi:hypothetical protein